MKKNIISIVSAMTGVLAGMIMSNTINQKALKDKQNMSDKHLTLYMLMNQWVQIKQDGKSLDTYLEKRQYKRIAIYGMNYVGETLLRELQGSTVEVLYAIDKNADHICAKVDVILPDEKLPKVDAIVVTPVTCFEEIRRMLEHKVNCPIISIEDMLYES